MVELVESVVEVVVVANVVVLVGPKLGTCRTLMVCENGHVECLGCSARSGQSCWLDVERSKTLSKMLCRDY